MYQYRRLPLTGLDNARELGGFAASNGGVTRYGVFFRSELPAELNATDLSFLRDRGLTTVIDLRSREEIVLTPDALAGQDWINYIKLPMFDSMAAQGSGHSKAAPHMNFSGWGAHYIAMAETYRDWTVNVLTELARADGAVLYHCTTGKDRTGLVTVFLLGICGVSNEDIIADYCVSQVYLRRKYMTMKHLMPPGMSDDLSDPFFSTAPDNMFELLEYLDGKYGGVCGYLRDCGATEELLSRIRDKFLEE